MNDSELVRLFSLRDASAMVKTREKYGQRLRALSLHFVRDEATAQECERDTYVCAWKSIPPQSPFDHFYVFLAQMLRYIALHRCRSRVPLGRDGFVAALGAELEECIPWPSNQGCQLSDAALGQLLNDFLEQLSAEKRRMFVRRYWYMDSLAELAQGFDMSEARVEAMLARCRRQLRLYVERKGIAL